MPLKAFPQSVRTDLLRRKTIVFFARVLSQVIELKRTERIILHQFPTIANNCFIRFTAIFQVAFTPAWAENKLAVLNAIDRELSRRDAWQGMKWRKA